MQSRFLNKKQPTAQRMAILTPEENARWEDLFAEYVEDGMEDEDADLETWADLQEEFPRLWDFDGISLAEESLSPHLN